VEFPFPSPPPGKALGPRWVNPSRYSKNTLLDWHREEHMAVVDSWRFLDVYFLIKKIFLSYGVSQARAPMGAVAAGPRHSQKLRIRAASATYIIAHGNTGSLTH